MSNCLKIAFFYKKYIFKDATSVEQMETENVEAGQISRPESPASLMSSVSIASSSPSVGNSCGACKKGFLRDEERVKLNCGHDAHPKCKDRKYLLYMCSFCTFCIKMQEIAPCWNEYGIWSGIRS